MRLLRCLLLCSIVLTEFAVVIEPSAALPLIHDCKLVGGSGYGSLGAAQHIIVTGSCPASGYASGSNVQTKTIFCGRASRIKGGPETQWDPRCGAPQQCFIDDPATDQPTLTDAFATITLVNGRWSDPVVWCPANAVPALPMAAIRQQAIRLLPHVRIGVAPPGGSTLVNMLTILWADTATDRTLPTATVVGRRVALRIHLTAADWNYGDGSTGATAGPGAPYDAAAHPCHTAACPGYDGHTYRTTGHRTITLTTRWHGQYSLNDGAAWLDIPGTLSGPTSSIAITVKQARAVLVPNPGDGG